MTESQTSTDRPRGRSTRRRGGSATLEQVTEAPPEATGDAEKPQGGPGGTQAPPASPEPKKDLPALPTEKTSSAGLLEAKTVLLHGEAGIGKSTLASEWADGKMFFFDTAGELKDLDVYRLPVTDWTSFREVAASYKAEMEKPDPRFAGCVIDTADVLAMFCAQHVRSQLGVVHQSDAEWGKGWDLLKEAWSSHLAKLAALGGVILVSHSKTKEIKKRRLKYDRVVPTLTGGIGEATVNMADLVLFVDWTSDEEEDETRVIYTKPSRDFEAKERGQTPRLPAEVEWPLGESGYQVLRRAWYGK
jgi:hypothetical protein